MKTKNNERTQVFAHKDYLGIKSSVKAEGLLNDPKAKSQLGFVVKAKYVDIQPEALELLKQVKQSGDNIGDIDIFQSSKGVIFSWLGGSLKVCKPSEIKGSNTYDSSLVKSNPNIETPQDFIYIVEKVEKENATQKKEKGLKIDKQKIEKLKLEVFKVLSTLLLKVDESKIALSTEFEKIKIYFNAEKCEPTRQSCTDIKGQFEKYGDVIKYNISDEQKDKIIHRLIEYYADPKHCHFGEDIHQDDDSIIDAPSVLSDICDNIIQFKTDDE